MNPSTPDNNSQDSGQVRANDSGINDATRVDDDSSQHHDGTFIVDEHNDVPMEDYSAGQPSSPRNLDVIRPTCSIPTQSMALLGRRPSDSFLSMMDAPRRVRLQDIITEALDIIDGKYDQMFHSVLPRQ
eukprot:CAMPEP_0113639664 /NCGR_PEP_ID=MMETSP0017_2-20120614/20813_1 /TAXON_ID=2856 /ORGANISM="Cylindrotheca closterium" /LENGTH=128 /DNA_ID=CAMNT_0000550899 /DNA_START=43 /DNA_END=429 /DNA_ORIENTATION=+ /assembly_acc=CAM_ASM_000147